MTVDQALGAERTRSRPMMHLMKRTLLLFLGLSLVVLAAYANAQSSPDVTGTWVGSTVRGAATVTMVLKQTGNRVTGTIVGAGTDDGRVEGFVDGNTIRLWFDQRIDDTPSLNIKGNEITGMLSGTEITFRRVGSRS
jgi:hypothetical protein